MRKRKATSTPPPPTRVSRDREMSAGAANQTDPQELIRNDV